MNSLKVTKPCTVYLPNVAPKAFVVNDVIAGSSPFYWTMLWSGNAVDSGTEDVTNAEQAFAPSVIVKSDVDPDLPEGSSVWIQTFANGDWTMWFEE